MSYSIALSAVDYNNLSRNLSLQGEIIARRFQAGRWADFKANDLKQILQYLKQHPIWKDNTVIKNCSDNAKEQIIIIQPDHRLLIIILLIIILEINILILIKIHLIIIITIILI